jgi:hypothetical protein
MRWTNVIIRSNAGLYSGTAALFAHCVFAAVLETCWKRAAPAGPTCTDRASGLMDSCTATVTVFASADDDSNSAMSIPFTRRRNSPP